jgi:uncharacterized cupin superfamily protein/uncharacterized protein YndB with AHSA1/START domain
MKHDPATFHTSRVLAAPPARVYAAFADARQLATWWGPAGFRNEFDAFDFQRGGRWKFVMIGPDGARHDNLNSFVELLAETRVVVQHESAPRFRLTVDLAPDAAGTLLSWTQVFEDPAVAAAVAHIVEPANEQNLDRLSALLAAGTQAAPSGRARELAAALIRNIDEVPLTRLLREPHYDARGAGLAQGTAARKLGASFDILAPGKRGCPYHLHHAQEEMFVILQGSGTLRVAGEMLPLRAGDVIFIPPGPEYPHQIINTSDAPLKVLSISTQEAPEICEYPDSGKFLAQGSRDDALPFEVIDRRGPGLDYWDGEA